ncbi:hypothetical protein TUSST3_89350 [Streptomyces sp. TUS-ST3]|nr:hypothetical protein TUSST3_89350 [Streptomyces sp. TUS-ST3]
MFATVHRDEDAEPAEYPEAVPRPGGGSGRPRSGSETAGAVGGELSATPAEIVAFFSGP